MSNVDILTNEALLLNNGEEKVIDLSDSSQYPASVLADVDTVFALGDDSVNFVSFLKTKWQQSIFHWGWEDISHEEAVKCDFLFRAICSLNIQYENRRDAMIASEGCRFVWKNKDVEPVPGLLSGEQLCDYMNRSLERDLDSIKSLNAFLERKARQWRLNPTYEDLMAELGKSETEADFYCRDMGCGMLCFRNKAHGNKQTFIVNPAIKKAYRIALADGELVGFTRDDIDWENVSQLEHHGDAERLEANYYFYIGDYRDGVARVDWMLYPDGRYFADEDGFGMEDNDEVRVSAYIDTECRVLVKFQDMEGQGKSKALFQEACDIAKGKRK